MIGVRINGEETPVRTEGLRSVAELVELLKTSIDPDHMITELLLNGRDLEESDWSSPVNRTETVIMEVQTGTPREFVNNRIAIAWEVVRQMFSLFREARKSFQGGNMVTGNKNLLDAVKTSQAFFEWYGSLMNLLPEGERSRYNIGDKVSEISEVCKRLCQQQLYQSWWALSQTIETELEPKLDKLEDFCRSFAS